MQKVEKNVKTFFLYRQFHFISIILIEMSKPFFFKFAITRFPAFFMAIPYKFSIFCLQKFNALTNKF